jgi:hypothetical protein
VFGETHLRRILGEFATYYNKVRIHRSLDKDAPVHRRIEHLGVIRSRPVLGGLHHQYYRFWVFRHTQPKRLGGCFSHYPLPACTTSAWTSLTALLEETHSNPIISLFSLLMMSTGVLAGAPMPVVALGSKPDTKSAIVGTGWQDLRARCSRDGEPGHFSLHINVGTICRIGFVRGQARIEPE